MSYSEFSQALTISAVVERYGVTARALRFYETKGLLAPHRRGRSRVYEAADLARLDFVIRARRLGFSLDEIKDMLDGVVDAATSGSIADARVARQRTGERVAALEILKDDIDVLLRELATRTKALDATLSKAGASLDAQDDLRARAAAFQRLGQSWVWKDAAL